MPALSREETAQILYQVGFRGNDLVNFVAIAGRESGYRPDARRTNNPGGQTGDFGLFQINYKNFEALQKAGIMRSPADLLNPVTNARAAKFLFDSGGYSPWGAGPGGWQQGGDPLYKTNVNAAKQAVDNAANRGMLGADWSAGGSGPSGPGGQPMSDPGTGRSGPFTLPSDAKLYNNGFTVVAVFEVAPGVRIGYSVNWTDGSVQFDPNKQTFVSPQQWAEMGVLDAGNAEELRSFSGTWNSYQQFFDRLLDETFGKNNPARSDAGVLRVLAEYAGRPDMTEAELRNKLQATDWYQSRTQGELEWNSLGDAERQKRRDDVAGRMSDDLFSIAGVRVDPSDPRILNYLEDVSSGKVGYGSWMSQMKTQALADSESPESRRLRDEQEQQRQRGVDVENTAQRVRTLAQRWGVTWDAGTYQSVASKIVSNEMSEADVIEMMKDQAQVLYPWKDRELETQTAAMPWVETYKRVMEKEGSLTNPQIQAALTSGAPVWDFERQLKRSTDWLGTRNAREEMYSTISEIGRRMGFE